MQNASTSQTLSKSSSTVLATFPIPKHGYSMFHGMVGRSVSFKGGPVSLNHFVAISYCGNELVPLSGQVNLIDMVTQE